MLTGDKFCEYLQHFNYQEKSILPDHDWINVINYGCIKNNYTVRQVLQENIFNFKSLCYKLSWKNLKATGVKQVIIESSKPCYIKVKCDLLSQSRKIKTVKQEKEIKNF